MQWIRAHGFIHKSNKFRVRLSLTIYFKCHCIKWIYNVFILHFLLLLLLLAFYACCMPLLVILYYFSGHNFHYSKCTKWLCGTATPSLNENEQKYFTINPCAHYLSESVLKDLIDKSELQTCEHDAQEFLNTCKTNALMTTRKLEIYIYIYKRIYTVA